MAVEEIVQISAERDIVAARSAARRLAAELGFSAMDQSRITTAVSELARNVVRYATDGKGTVRLKELDGDRKVGIEVTVHDDGPGIADLAEALTPGRSSGKGLGLGLSGTKRLTDEMEIHSTAGIGTTVIIRKWKR